MAPKQWHNIVVCCDGTWCGSETGTRTNIQILADAFATSDPDNIILVPDGAISKDNKWNSIHNEKTNTDVIYFNGVGTSGIEAAHEPEGLGLMGGLLDMLVYCINGAVARDLYERCKEAYRFIKDMYRGPDESRIWLFGLSRGAYTVRAVAGMINNCGITKKDWAGVPGETLDYSQEVLLDAVWDIYKSNDEDCHPKGKTSREFKRTANKVWPKGSTPPIVFMGLLDTVGAVGLPRISGVGAKPLTYDYVSLRDLAVSTEVQNVFQACSTHDRLTPFEPCFVRRSEQYDHNCLAIVDKLKADRIAQDAHQPEYNGVQYTTEEVWYPGAHYDLGRQDFIIGNQPFTNSFNKRVNLFRTNVKCLPELADYPLVGYELQPKQGDPAPPLCSLDSYPPCIVGRVCSIDSTLLPPPSDARLWTALVKGKPPSKGSQCWVLSVAAAVVVFVGRNIPGPVKLFMPPYDVDAETEILGSLAKYAGVVVKGRYDAEVVLKDRTIPLPGVDDWGFRLAGKAEFFPVPQDGGGHTSYEAHGRERNQGGKWFMSQTYNQYISDLKAGRKNSGEKKWAAIRVAGFDKPAESGASAAASTEAVLHEQEQQQQQHGTASANSHPVLLGAS